MEKVSIELRKRTGLIKRVSNRLPRDKVFLAAESIFNSVIRYGICVYLTPTYEKEDVKIKKLPSNTKKLQVLQNNMIRVIMGLKLEHQTNMEELRNKIRMMSVNQICVYHTLLEAFNVSRKASSEQVKAKWEHKNGETHFLRRKDNLDLRVPDRAKVKCTGYTYHGAKLFNMLPAIIRNCANSDTYKSLIKSWIWETIPPF